MRTLSTESRTSRIGRITLDAKQTGERKAGNPPIAFDVAGTGNVAWSRCCDTSQPKGRGNREHKLRPKPARQSPTLPTWRGLETWHGRDAVTPRNRKGEATGNTNSDLNRRASLRPYLVGIGDDMGTERSNGVARQ